MEFFGERNFLGTKCGTGATCVSRVKTKQVEGLGLMQCWRGAGCFLPPGSVGVMSAMGAWLTRFPWQHLWFSKFHPCGYLS